MQRYFSKGIVNEDIILTDGDIHHIKNVMRNKIGDMVEVVDNNTLYNCEIESIVPFKIKIVDQIREDRELPVEVIVAISLVQEQKFDLILQKLTELGISKIIPLKTARSIVKIDDKKVDKKLDRWRVICKEAAEQSKRIRIPVVESIMNFKDICKVDADIKLICSLRSNSKSIGNYLDNDKRSILFVIGPEGGFTTNEEELLLNNEFKPITLGKRVLRVETAAITVASIISYIYEG